MERWQVALFCHKITLGIVFFHLANTCQHNISLEKTEFFVSITFYMCLLQWSAMLLQALHALFLPFPVLIWQPGGHLTYMVISLLILLLISWQFILQSAKQLISLLIDEFALACALHHLLWTCEFSTEKSLHCSNIQAQTSRFYIIQPQLYYTVLYSHNWIVGDLCIQPSAIDSELLHKVTLMDMGISLSCRIRKKRLRTSRLGISYRCPFCWFFVCFFYEWNI